jgi:hypothetical protein
MNGHAWPIDGCAPLTAGKPFPLHPYFKPRVNGSSSAFTSSKP